MPSSWGCLRVPSPLPRSVSLAQGQHLALVLSMPACVCAPALLPTLHLEAEGTFFRTLKWLLKVSPLQPRGGGEAGGGQWFSQIGVLGPGQARVWA